VFNLPGEVADGGALTAAIEAAVPGAGQRIEFEPGDMPFPSEIDHDGIEAIDPAPATPLAVGVDETVQVLRALAQVGRLDPAEHGLEPVASPNYGRTSLLPPIDDRRRDPADPDHLLRAGTAGSPLSSLRYRWSR
jgi:hypothetical protein